jgi:hypothetical protein
MNVLAYFICGLADPPCTRCARFQLTRIQRRVGNMIGVAAGLCALWIWAVLASMLGVGWLYAVADTLKSAALPGWLDALLTITSFALAYRSGRATAYWYFLWHVAHEPPLRCKCVMGVRACPLPDAV